ncbi:MAG: right-handed parallel beta-helix repeat-containing protein [Acidobacteriota bacterium]
MRHLSRVVLYTAISTVSVAPAAAEPITWADPAGLCAGNLPCFTSLADAVANAGPAPAQVFVFPGTYAESVDLGNMGSALPGGAPGELAIVSVDAGGQTSPGATVDPGAPSGPGTGDAITATGFPAPLTLDGLAVRSPDLNGIFLTGGGAGVLLRGVDASGSPMGNGAVVANATGTVEVVDSTAVLNRNAGFNLASQAGLVIVSGSLAERNDGAGFAIVAASATILDSRSEANGDDGWLVFPSAPGGSSDLTNVVSSNNAGRGLFGINADPTSQFSTVTATNLTLRNNASQGGILVGGVVTLNQITITDNGGDGLTVGGESVGIEQLTSERNGGSGGLIFVSDQIAIADANIADNLDGGLGAVAAEGDTATATASGIVSNRNMGTGFVLAGLQDSRFAAVDVAGVTAVDNTEGGVFATATLATATQITATNNGSMGFTLDAVELADASWVTASGHVVGITVGAAQDARLRDSDASNNTSGILMGGARAAVDRVSAVLNGPGNGNLASGAGFVFLNAEDLDVTDSRAESNETGWFFLEVSTSGPSRLIDGLSALGVQPPEAWLDPKLPADLAGFVGSTSPAGPTAPAGPFGEGSPPQRITIETSRTLDNTEASMVAVLRDGGSFRVSCSDFAGNGPSGFELLTANTVEAQGNYWGAPDGPTHPGNPAGTGDLVSDGLAGGSGVVQWLPFLTAPATPDDCPAFVVDVPAVTPTGLALLALALIGSACVLLRPKP